MRAKKLFSILPVAVLLMVSGCFFTGFFVEEEGAENGLVRFDINFAEVKEGILNTLKEQERDKLYEQSSLIKSEIIHFLVNMDVVDQETLEPIK